MKRRPGVLTDIDFLSHTHLRAHRDTQREKGAVACHCQSVSHRGVDSHLVHSTFIYSEETRTERQQGWTGQRDSTLESKTRGRNKNNTIRNKMCGKTHF